MRPTLTYLAMRARALAPQRLRTAYRALRAPDAVPPSQVLTPELVGSARMFADRVHMLSALPRGGVVAELGTYRGDFARHIVAQTAPSALHLIDIDFTPFNATDLDGPTVHRHVGLTREVIATFADETFDWIYVDGDHSYAAAMGDAEAAAPKVRRGGYLVFNDFAIIDPYLGRYGVHAAVTRFATTHKWPVKLFAFQPSGLYDIALQRPH
jgi:predicted O-methyltransferase YrrM